MSRAPYPKGKLEVAFTTGPFDANPVYTDLGNRVVQYSTNREIGRAGTGTFIVENTDGALHPHNRMSPFYGNLLTENQSSFETDTTGWAALSNCTISRITTDFVHGVAALQANCTAGGSDVSFTTSRGTSGVPIAEGASIEGLLQLKCGSAVFRNAYLVLSWFNAAGGFMSDTTGSVSLIDASWRELAVSGTAPATARYVSIAAFVQGMATNEKVRADKANVAGYGPTTLGWNLGGKGGLIQPMCKIRYSEQWNLLTANQADLTTDTTGWTAYNIATLTRETGTYMEGVGSLKLTATGAGDMGAQTLTGTSAVAVTAGVTYAGFASFRSASASRNTKVGIRWWTSAGVAISTTFGSSVAATSAGWTKAFYSAEAPATAAYASVVAQVLSAALAEVWFVDAVGFNEGDTTTWMAGGPQYLFTGYVEEWASEWENIKFGNMAITAVDGNKPTTLIKPAKSDFFLAVFNDTPSGYFQFNEVGNVAVSGLVTLEDSSGNNRDGTYRNNPDYLQNPAIPSEAGTSVKFSWGETDLAGAHAEIPSATCPTGTTNFTIEAWIHPVAIRIDPLSSTLNRIWYVQSPGSQQLFVSIWNDGRVNFAATDGANGGTLNSTTAVALNRWNHIVCVKSGTTGPTNWAIYIDGVDVSDHPGQTTSGTGNCNLTAAAALLGGRTVPSVARGAFDGYMDEFAVYHSALSSARVTAHYAASYDLAKPVLTGARIGKMLDLIGFPTADRTLDTGQYLIRQVEEPLYDNPPYEYIARLVESEGWPAAFFFAGNGNAVFQDRAHSTPTSAATFSDASSTLYYDAGPGPVRSDRVDLWTRVVLQADGGQPQVATDATAAARYWERTLTRTGLKNASDADVATVAASELARFKTPRDRMERMSFQPVFEPGTMWPQALGRELNDRISVVRTDLPGGGDTLTLDVRIVGISQQGAPGGRIVTWALSPT